MSFEFTGDVILRPSFAPRPGISHVLFDFDGTLSLIRQGWPEVMVPMFTEVLPAPARRDRGGSPSPGLRGHHAAQRQADHLPDDPACRADPRAGRPARGAALVQARIPAAARPPDRRPGDRTPQGDDPAR